MKARKLLSVGVFLGIVLCQISAQHIQTTEIGNNRYFFSDSTPYSPRLNWFLAYQYCRSIGMDLLAMPRKEEASEVMEHIRQAGKSDYSYWTSGNQLGSPMWMWMTSGQPLNTTFSFWTSAGPPLTKTNKACMELEGGIWYSANCMDEKAFICHLSRCYFFNYAVTNRRNSIQGRNKSRITNTKGQRGNSTTTISSLTSNIPRKITVQKDSGKISTNTKHKNGHSNQSLKTTRTQVDNLSNKDVSTPIIPALNLAQEFQLPEETPKLKLMMNKFREPSTTTQNNTDPTIKMMNKFQGPNSDDLNLNSGVMNKFSNLTDTEEIKNEHTIRTMNKFRSSNHSDIHSGVTMNKFTGPSNLKQNITNHTTKQMNKFQDSNSESSTTQSRITMNKFTTPSTVPTRKSRFPSRNTKFGDKVLPGEDSPLLLNNLQSQNEIIPKPITPQEQRSVTPTPQDQRSVTPTPQDQRSVTPRSKLSFSLSQELLPPIQLTKLPKTDFLPSIGPIFPSTVTENNTNSGIRKLQRRQQFRWAFS